MKRIETALLLKVRAEIFLSSTTFVVLPALPGHSSTAAARAPSSDPVFLPVMSDLPQQPLPRPDAAAQQRPAAPLADDDPNLRGYFVDDEVTREASLSAASAGMPPIEATSSSSPTSSRRKQTTPHKVGQSTRHLLT